MSVPKLPVVLTSDAEIDLRGILLYSRRQWGTVQRDTYRAAIRRALNTIATNPSIGHPYDRLRPGRRSFPVQRHVIHYRIDDDRVTILRILHERMDVARHLTDEDDESP